MDGRNAAGSSAGMIEKSLAAQCQREPTWEECPLEVKVERVRQALMRMEHILDSSFKRATEAVKVAKTHCHDPIGRVVVQVTHGDALGNFIDAGDLDLRHIFRGLR